MVQKLPAEINNGTRDDWTWSKKDKSHEVRIRHRGRRAHFHPKWSNGTAAVRGNRVLNHGKHYWEVKVTQRIFGTSMMFGIATRTARLHANAFTNLLGEDGQSWGLSHKGLLWHAGKWKLYTKPFKENEATTIGMLFDWYQGTLTYFKDGVSLGIAFTGLNAINDVLYPIISSTAAKTEMSLQRTVRGFYDLQDRCRAAILRQTERANSVDQLPLPNCMLSYLKDGLRCRQTVRRDKVSSLLAQLEAPVRIAAPET